MTLKDSLLWPLSLPYGAVAHLRARAYRKGLFRQGRLEGKVISVGNLTVGGTGKTPMVMWIAERLLAEGKSVGILTRGYRGKVAAASGSASNAGKATGAAIFTSDSDEVRLMQSRLGDRVAFGVGADRYERGKELAKRGVDWFVLDDGFQHLRLARDVDIVLIDATNPFGGGRLLPAGRLREPRSALARADIVVITRSSHAPAIEAAVRRDSEAPIFYARAEMDSVCASFGPQLTEKDARGRKLFAFCGIGNPPAFVADLRDWRFQIAGHKFFPDHHRYSASDIAGIEREAKAAGATDLICTEKDSFNFTDIKFALEVWVCTISLRIDREDDFWRTVIGKVGQSRAQTVR